MSDSVRPKVLISAYACEPERGSEAAVGWNWALQMSRYYEVHLITRRSRQKTIEASMKEAPMKNLNFVYVDYPDWIVRFKKGSLMMNIYYLAWQVLAYFRSRRLVAEEGIQLAHHVSFMSVTRGSFVPFLGVKSIVGPVGGLQTVPEGGRRLIRNKFVESIRNFGVKFFRFNLIGALPSSFADHIILATGANHDALPAAARQKTIIGLQIGTERVSARKPPSADGLFVFRWIGRMVDHKGFEILIDALVRLRADHPDEFAKTRVVVSGNGPLADDFREQIQKKELEQTFEFVAWLSTDEMNELWNRCHGFLFTSLRETTGLALLEAMTRGVPPIVIDNGGPSEIVSETCGIKISAENYDDVVRDYTAAMLRFIQDPEALLAIGEEARERAISHYSWDAVGQRMNTIYQNLLNESE